MENVKTSDKKKSRGNNRLLLASVGAFIVMVFVVFFLIYKFYMSGFGKLDDYTTYEEYYVMITNNQRSSFMQNIYDGAYKAGIEQGVYVDLLSESMPNDYSDEDLMKIAISSEVDGIIIDADESEEITELINYAFEQGIPVVTLLNDNANSKRCSFVGIGGYEIGREYGSQVIQIANELKNQNVDGVNGSEPIGVAILINSTNNNSNQNVIISGIRETIEAAGENTGSVANIEIVSVDNSNAFSVEESIRDIFIDGDLPSVVICLDELSTTCVYQAVIDYNVVGKVNILGYYDSNTIINAIDRGVIYSTVSVDTKQLGEYCVTALRDYNELGATSQYYPGDVTLVDKDNVSEYKKTEEANDE